MRYREILRLSAHGLSQANVAWSVGCSASTVNETLKRAAERGVSWPLPEGCDDAWLGAELFPRTGRRADAGKAPIDHELVERELSRKGVTLQLLWAEYCERARAAGLEPYMYTQFCYHHRKWARSPEGEAVMRVRWVPGEVTQVDWAGDTASVLDASTGELLPVYVFVASLPFSEYLFAEGFPDMAERSWVRAHVDAFAFFGGSTPLVVPDNAKTAVKSNTLSDLVLNEQYHAMCEHYRTACVPAPPRTPRAKAGVEMNVGLVERQVVAPLRDRVFLSVAELNRAMAARVREVNSRPFQKRAGSRESVFLEQERARLQPLPPEPYEMVERAAARVGFSYHVRFDRRYYSVPYQYVRREVEVAATAARVKVTCGGEVIAVHERSYGPEGDYVTDGSHMPGRHRDRAEWSGDRFRSWAAEKGPAAAEVCDRILRSRQYEEQSFRSCRALLALGEKHGDDVLEAACAEALRTTGRPSYKTVKALAARVVEQRRADPDAHAYLRGADYYRSIDEEGEGERDG